jgi:hypothetical protein
VEGDIADLAGLREIGNRLAAPSESSIKGEESLAKID